MNVMYGTSVVTRLRLQNGVGRGRYMRSSSRPPNRARRAINSLDQTMARLALLLALVLGVGTSVANASEKPVVPKDPKLRGVPHSLKLKGQFVSLPASGSLLNAMPSWIRDSPAFSADAGVWKCLDGNGVIPWEWVNDDYCDCKDGSDEPGTAACAHIQGAKWVFKGSNGQIDVSILHEIDRNSGLVESFKRVLLEHWGGPPRREEMDASLAF